MLQQTRSSELSPMQISQSADSLLENFSYASMFQCSIESNDSGVRWEILTSVRPTLIVPIRTICRASTIPFTA